MAKRKVIKETLGELSERWCRINRLPAGLYLTMLDSRNHQKRSDTVISRRALPSRSEDDTRLSTALEDLQEALVTNVGQRKLTLVLRKPNKKNIPRQTQIATIRGLDIEGEFPTQKVGDLACERMTWEEAVETAQDHVYATMMSDEDAYSIGQEALVRGALRAVVEYSDRQTVIKALDELGL